MSAADHGLGVRLARGAVMPMRNAAGTAVTAHAGVLWITEENSARDVLLRAGESFHFRRSGLTLVEAWTEAALTFSVV